MLNLAYLVSQETPGLAGIGGKIVLLKGGYEKYKVLLNGPRKFLDAGSLMEILADAYALQVSRARSSTLRGLFVRNIGTTELRQMAQSVTFFISVTIAAKTLLFTNETIHLHSSTIGRLTASSRDQARVLLPTRALTATNLTRSHRHLHVCPRGIRNSIEHACELSFQSSPHTIRFVLPPSRESCPQETPVPPQNASL